MNPIIAPIAMGQSGAEVQNLQDGLLLLLEKGVISNNNNQVPLAQLNNERLQSFFGDATATAVKQFAQQYQLQVQAPTLVNNQVAASLNNYINQYPPVPAPEMINVTGVVRHVSGNLLTSNYTVRIEQVKFDTINELVSTQINSTGYYAAQFYKSNLQQQADRYALRIVVEVDNVDYPSPKVFLLPDQTDIIINALVDSPDAQLHPEFTSVNDKIENVIGSTSIMNITVDGPDSDVAYIASVTNESKRDVYNVVKSYLLTNDLGVNEPELIYGLLQQNMPSTPEQLVFQPTALLKTALITSMQNKIIGTYSDSAVNSFLDTLKTGSVTAWNNTHSGNVQESATYRVYNKVLNNSNLTNNFMTMYFGYETNGTQGFWDYLPTQQAYATYAKDLKAMTEMAPMAGSNPAMTYAMLGLLKGGTYSGNKTLPVSPNVLQPQLLARLSRNDWQDLIETVENNDQANFFYPDYADNGYTYASRLYANYATVYPVHAINAALEEDENTGLPEMKQSLNTFLDSNANFDLRVASILDLSSPSSPYSFAGVADKAAFIEEIATTQRLLTLTSNYAAISAMARDGVVSSFHISRMSLDDYLISYSDYYEYDAAPRSVYDTALSVTAHAVLSAYDTYFDVAGYTRPWSGIDPLTATPIGTVPIPPEVDPYAEWRSLFGNMDGCTCCNCQSVYSPSAYLVDSLHFLKTRARDVHNDLVYNRRPDIQYVELTCDNTNIPLPYIDLVNEVLEDIAGTGNYQMYARQTHSDAAHLRAIPEYINTDTFTSGSVTVESPYKIKLLNSKYPWTLPYNFYKRQIDTHLGIAGVKSYELKQRFSALNRVSAWSDYCYCIAYLGISNEAADIITTGSSTVAPYAPLQEPYGFKAAFSFPSTAPLRSYIPDPKARGSFVTVAADWTETLTGRIDIFLQQTKLSYKELLTALDCFFLNGIYLDDSRRLAITNNSATTDVTTCKLYELKIDPVTPGEIPVFLDKLHRFVRFARALNWGFYDLDKALRSINTSELNTASFVKIVQIKALADTLRISPDDATTLFLDIEQKPYRDYGKEDDDCDIVDIPNQYQRIFRNPALLNAIEANGYPFLDNGNILSVDKEKLRDYMAGITQINPNDMGLLLQDAYTLYGIPGTDFTPSIQFLSYVYRQSVLLRALGVNVQDWLYYKKWISNSNYFGDVSGGADPVNDTSSKPVTVNIPPTSAYTAIPFDTLRFCSVVRLFKDAGIKAADVEYLLLDSAPDSISDDKANASLANTLTGLRTELSKKWYPAFASGDFDASQELLDILKLILTEPDAKGLMNILDRVKDDVPAYTADDAAFIRDQVFFLPTGSDDILTNPSAPGYLSSARNRYDYVYNNQVTYMRQEILKPAAANFLSTSFGLEESITYLLLDQLTLSIMGTGFDMLLNTEFVTGTNTLDRWDPSSYVQFMVMLMLAKASLLINKFGLGLQEVQYLWINSLDASPGVPVIPDIPMLNQLPARFSKGDVFVPGTTSTLTFRLLRNLLQWMQVRAFTGADINILFAAIQAGSTTVVTTVANVFKMTPADADSLLHTPVASSTDQGLLHINPATAFRIPLSYLRVIDCLEMQYLLPTPMANLGLVASAVSSASKQLDASNVIHLVKAPYNDKQWLGAIQPVNDLLRTERRNALVAFLLAYPPDPYKYSWLSSDDIYETLMIDVEMMPIVSTTRVLQAVNTVQTWMNRTLLQLEVNRVTSDVARQWNEWRRLYRLWEANRKVFLYPENWIEPELRDNKSPFFLELEKFLKQNEVTQQNVETAYRTYLERLDQVSHLDIIGVYREPAPNEDYKKFDVNSNTVTHVFARTKSQPHIYFYRKRANKEWTAWEKMDTKIDGDHFIPIMWRGRLRLYWLVFTKEQEGKTLAPARDSGDAFVNPPAVRWKIELAWTEYKDGNWNAQEISKEALYTAYIYEELPTSDAHMRYYCYNKAAEGRVWNRNGDLDLIRKESINFFCNITPDGNLQFKVIERYFGLTQAVINGMLATYEVTDKWGNHTYTQGIESTIDEGWNTWNSQRNWSNLPGSDFWNTNGAFNVKFNGVSAVPQPSEDAGISIFQDYPWTGPWMKDLQNNDYWPEYSDYWYRKTADLGYSHFPDGNIKLLGYAPGHEVLTNQPYIRAQDGMPRTKTVVVKKEQAKFIVLPRHLPANYTSLAKIEVPHFFYKDYLNTFFVEKVSLPTTFTVSAVADSIGQGFKLDSKAITGIGLSGIPISGTVTGIGILGSSATGISTSVSLLPTATGYRFHNFTHDKVELFMEKLYNEGLDGLLDRAFLSGLTDNINFASIYKPTGNVLNKYPSSAIDFSAEGAYAQYNWELFYHIPMLIANKLSIDQQFSDARNWYQYVFDPTNADAGSTISKFWNFQPFYDIGASVPSVEDTIAGPDSITNIEKWAENPFMPHLVARTRPSAYMKNTVMKYLDNLIAWGDNLFRSDSREAINEATLLYVMAAQILGRRPEEIPMRAKPQAQTYYSLDATGSINEFGNAMVRVENILLSSGASRHYHEFSVSYYGLSTTTPVVSFWPPYISLTAPFRETVSMVGNMYYFCTPTNDKLLQYWDILADRLFKIRNSQNIDGVTRELALFDPPIDPAILVKAAAAGVSLAGVIGDINAQLPAYRFNILAQKATELVQEVKGLGSQLLSALEKKDTESIALLRSSQEINVLQAMTDLREQQVEESTRQYEALQTQLTSTTQRRDYYQNLLSGGLITKEQIQLGSAAAGLALTTYQAGLNALAAGLQAIPNVMVGAFSFGAQYGGDNAGGAGKITADVVGLTAAINSQVGMVAGINAGFERRKQEWAQQLTLANTEMEQMNTLILAAEIRVAMAQTELKNHQLQLKNAEDLDTAMRDKYTNEELYDWMIGQLSFTYFQGYKLAYETAKKAETCFRYELNLDTSDYIQYGYWDSLRKGLLAGESLAYDLKRMEAAYLDKNRRQLELTRHVSLAALDPDALMALRINRNCQISLPEWLFDMDYPGQHMRRIKSVSISIPCVAGPYTTISCKLSQVSSKYRKNSFLLEGDYAENPEGSDSRFTYMFGNIQSIVTSNAQNDNGLFEFSFRDERYLPFEGTGAISSWSLELPQGFAQFDYNSISDVILHVKYTAQDSGALKQGAISNLADMMSSSEDGFFRLFNLRQEFSNEWYQLLNGTTSALVLDNIKARLPYLAQALSPELVSIEIFMDQSFKVTLQQGLPPTTATEFGNGFYRAELTPMLDMTAIWQFYFLNVTLANVKNAWMVIHYTTPIS